MTPTAAARAAFLEGTAELARELGQGITRRPGDDGFVAETWIASSRQGIEPYRMLRSLGGYWMHADTRCEGFLQYDYCRHVDAAEDRENKMSEATDLIVYTNPLALAQHVSVEEVIAGFTAVGEWRYAFRRKGQEIEGLSADGVQDGVRQMARQGEAIRCTDVHLESETDREARFIAKAGRYAIAPDGRELLLDSTLRGKRIPKWEVHSSDDQYGKWKKGDEYFNEDWFEHGVTKAARNAEEALMPEALKQWMLQAAKGVVKPQQAPARPQRQSRQESPAAPDAVVAAATHDAAPSQPASGGNEGSGEAKSTPPPRPTAAGPTHGDVQEGVTPAREQLKGGSSTLAPTPSPAPPTPMTRGELQDAVQKAYALMLRGVPKDRLSDSKRELLTIMQGASLSGEVLKLAEVTDEDLAAGLAYAQAALPAF